MAISVRPATAQDTKAAVQVLRRSIAELCTQDHLNDATQLQDWLSNKTVAQFGKWLEVPEALILVAESDDGEIAGVGGCRLSGQILLNYVSPDFRFVGVSSKLLEAMEHRLRRAGVKKASLTSTVTAHRFYVGRGYEDVTPEGMQEGPGSARQMQKVL